MIALAVLPVLAVVIAAPVGSDEACPSARQVTEAMHARFPAFLIAPESAAVGGRPDVLRAILDVAADGTVVRFSLVDVRGETQLRRTLPAPGRGRPLTDCLALADTLAAIVERYLGSISYDAPDIGALDPVVPPTVVGAPTPPGAPALVAVAPRTALVMVGLGWRMPNEGQNAAGEVEARLAAEVELTRATPRMTGLISAGVAPAITAEGTGGGRDATLRRFPFRLGALLKLPAGPGWVEPSVALGVDLLAASSAPAQGASSAQSFRFAPGLEAAVGYRLKLVGPFHVRPRAAIGIAIKRYDIALSGDPDVVFSTPRAYASFGIDTGVVFQ